MSDLNCLINPRNGAGPKVSSEYISSRSSECFGKVNYTREYSCRISISGIPGARSADVGRVQVDLDSVWGKFTHLLALEPERIGGFRVLDSYANAHNCDVALRLPEQKYEENYVEVKPLWLESPSVSLNVELCLYIS